MTTRRSSDLHVVIVQLRHASQFTKLLSSLTLEGSTLLQIQKIWDAILSVFWQSLSTNNIWPAYKYLKADHHELYSIIIPLDTHTKFAKEKEKYESLYRALRFNLVKDETIPSSKAPKLYVNLIKYINIDNGFDLLIAVYFSMSTQLGELGPKSQYLVISFRLGEGGLSQNSTSELFRPEVIFLLDYETGKIKNLTSEFIMKLFKLKHLQLCMKKFGV